MQIDRAGMCGDLLEMSERAANEIHMYAFWDGLGTRRRLALFRNECLDAVVCLTLELMCGLRTEL